LSQQALYGYSSTHPLAFRKVLNDVFFIDDPEIRVENILTEPLPVPPVEPTFSCHWLAVDGIQPLVPQNPHPATIRAKEAKRNKASDSKLKKAEASAPKVQPLVKHVLSKEQQMYYQQVIAAIRSSDRDLQQAVLDSLSRDAAIQQLVPYFTKFIADEVTNNLRKLSLLRSLMEMTACLLHSPHIQIEPYLHQLMPCILTCLVGKSLCETPSQDHWSLRDYAADLVSTVCSLYGHVYNNLQPRITKTLARAFLDPNRPVTTHYGAIVGLSGLGPFVIKCLILPHIKVYMRLLEAELASPNATKRTETQHVHGALLRAAGIVVKQEYTDVQQAAKAYSDFLERTKTMGNTDSESKSSASSASVSSSAASVAAAATAAAAAGTISNGAVTLPEASSGGRKRKHSSHQDYSDVIAHVPPPELAISMDDLFEMFGEALLPFCRVSIICCLSVRVCSCSLVIVLLFSLSLSLSLSLSPSLSLSLSLSLPLSLSRTHSLTCSLSLCWPVSLRICLLLCTAPSTKQPSPALTTGAGSDLAGNFI
jgi:transcription initiation factor TFIID subunit 6